MFKADEDNVDQQVSGGTWCYLSRSILQTNSFLDSHLTDIIIIMFNG